MDTLEGRVAVVTGGASGIGRGLCTAFAGAGLGVVVSDIDEAGAEAVAGELRAGGARAFAVAADVTDAASVEALAERAFSLMGAVHIVCNNAGVIVGGALQDATDSDWQWVLSVNLYGVIHGCRAFVPRLLAQGEGGHIVNTASMGGHLAGPQVGVYCTSKFAVVGFSESLRAELAPQGIGVSVLCPGGVRTNLLEAARHRPAELADTGGDAEMLRRSLERGIDPAEVGGHVLRGIARDELYIFTHESFRAGIEARFQQILAAFEP